VTLTRGTPCVNVWFFVVFVYWFDCYYFHLFYFAMCGDFNFFPSYSIVEINYNMMFGMIGLLVMSIFGSGVLI
jgi:hypothetical protein